MQIYKTLENGINIVEYHPSLAAGIAEMRNLSSEDWGGQSGDTESQVLARHAGASYLNVYIALDGDIVVGYCSFGKDYFDANTLYIAYLTVRPDYQNKKIGKALVLMCVNRTIELGYPRLTLHTWSGNTAAVPLYKKCGFMWEDRPNSVYLTNLIPTIATNPLFTGFFAKADWYADSIRSLEISPDGEKINDFENFCYTWEKGGDNLKVGFERTGRQIRMIETADYKIELTAQDHKLAYGLDYNCSFLIENKSGKNLNIKITGQDDKNIKFNYNLDTQVTGVQEFPASFYIGEISEPQDEWRLHPCLLANVEINGQAITFGMGIDTKFPISIGLHREVKVSQKGMEYETHLNLESALLEDANITINVPDNNTLTIKGSPFAVNIPSKRKACIETTSTTLNIGSENLTVHCKAIIKNGKEFNFTVPLQFDVRDLTSAYAYENLYGWNIVNGPWQLAKYKQGSDVDLSHLLNASYWSNFEPPKFGKPYDDEFNLMKPKAKMYRDDTKMVMELEYASEKYAGMVVTQIYTLCASGVVTRANRVENRSSINYDLMMRDTCFLCLGDRTIFSYNGQIMQNHTTPHPDGDNYGFSAISPEEFDENWVFEASSTNPAGYVWPIEYKPVVQWGSGLIFEHSMGELAPGQTCETLPIVCTYGLFTNYNDLRNYARQIFKRDVQTPIKRVEVRLNGYNPFVAGKDVKLEVDNNRNIVLQGDLIVSSNLFKTQIQTNPADERVPCNKFDLQLSKTDSAIEVVNLVMNLAIYEKSYNRALFFPKGNVSCTRDDTRYVCSNGAITFKADPKYGHMCYSLTDTKGQEWLLNQYPEHKPFAWWNPFLGGISPEIPHMNTISLLKETVIADFAEKRDNYGNIWSGICTTLHIQENHWLKDATYKCYYLTLPGLPLLCTFFELHNNTGQGKGDVMGITAFLNVGENVKDVFVEATNKNRDECRLRLGSDGVGTQFENIAVVKSPRAENLYAFRGNKGNPYYQNGLNGDNKMPLHIGFYGIEASAPNGGVFTSCPIFLLVTDKNLPEGALDDLERLKF